MPQVTTLPCHAEKEDPAVPSRCYKSDSSSVTLQDSPVPAAIHSHWFFSPFDLPEPQLDGFTHKWESSGGLTQTGWMFCASHTQELKPHTKNSSAMGASSRDRNFFPAATSIIPLIMSPVISKQSAVRINLAMRACKACKCQMKLQNL